MRPRACIAFAGAACAAALALGFAQPKAPDAPPIAPAASKASDVAKLAFLAGTWRGEIDGSMVEETWSAPSGSHIIGMFRWMNPPPDGSLMMTELLNINGESTGTRLRLVHFDPAMRIREKEGKPLVLKLVSVEGTRAEFAAEDAGMLSKVVYEAKGDRLAVDVIFKAQGDQPREPILLRLTRVQPGR